MIKDYIHSPNILYAFYNYVNNKIVGSLVLVGRVGSDSFGIFPINRAYFRSENAGFVFGVEEIPGLEENGQRRKLQMRSFARFSLEYFGF